MSRCSRSSMNKKAKNKNSDDLVLSKVKRNIKEDNDVLNNPGQFYNGFFNDIMKKVNKKKKLKNLIYDIFIYL